MAFCQWVIPLVDSFLSLMCQWVEMVKIQLVEKTTESTVHISKLKEDLGEGNSSSARAIGFVIPEQEDGEDYYEDD